MTELQVFDLSRFALTILLEIAAPFLILALVVGLVISLFQALTSIQEMTLTFVPKLVVLLIAFMVLTPYVFGKMRVLMQVISDLMVGG